VLIGEERHVVSRHPFEKSPDHRRPDPLMAMSGSRPDIHQPGVANTIREQPGGRDDLRPAADEGGGEAVLKRSPQLLWRAPVVETVSRQGCGERLPIDALEVVADQDCRLQLRPPGRSASSGSD
jgi:hypothetical protein